MTAIPGDHYSLDAFVPRAARANNSAVLPAEHSVELPSSSWYATVETRQSSCAAAATGGAGWGGFYNAEAGSASLEPLPLHYQEKPSVTQLRVCGQEYALAAKADDGPNALEERGSAFSFALSEALIDDHIAAEQIVCRQIEQLKALHVGFRYFLLTLPYAGSRLRSRQLRIILIELMAESGSDYVGPAAYALRHLFEDGEGRLQRWLAAAQRPTRTVAQIRWVLDNPNV